MQLMYVTCSSKKEAEDIGRHLLNLRVCGCVNILGPTQSLYWWPPEKPKMVQGQEYVILIKTVKAMHKRVIREVEKMHSADTPCIMTVDVAQINPAYQKWLMSEMHLDK